MIFATRKNIEEIRRQAFSEANRERYTDERFCSLNERIDRIEKRICVLEDRLAPTQKPCNCLEDNAR